MADDTLAQLAARLVAGDPEGVLMTTRQSIELGLEPLAIIEGGLMPGMREVGERYATGEFFLPNLIVAAAGMKKAMALLDPLLRARQQKMGSGDSVVIGTVRGDIHEIGKSIVATMLAANGFDVHDLGVDVPAERFVETAQQTGATLVGLSALLTTTMPAQREVVAALVRAGIRDRVKVMVGGAPISAKWSLEIGADGYAENAITAVVLAKELTKGLTGVSRQ